MSTNDVVHIPSRSVAIYEGLAECVGLSLDEYTQQSLTLGVNLARIAILSGTECAIAHATNNEYQWYPINFLTLERPNIPMIEPSLAILEAGMGTARQPLQLEVPAERISQVEVMSGLFLVEPTMFIECSLTHRWLWGVSRQQQTEIYIDDGNIDDQYIIGEDRLLTEVVRTI